jgi:hypothetical protein
LTHMEALPLPYTPVHLKLRSVHLVKYAVKKSIPSTPALREMIWMRRTCTNVPKLGDQVVKGDQYNFASHCVCAGKIVAHFYLFVRHLPDPSFRMHRENLGSAPFSLKPSRSCRDYNQEVLVNPRPSELHALLARGRIYVCMGNA